MDTDELRTRVRDGMPQTIDDLSRLVAIPSVGHAGFDPAHVRASAELTRDILASAGARGARLIELEGGHPAVYAEIPGPPDAPTLLLYAHHDVQPEGDATAWASPPYAPEIRDGRMYGRGSADDKSGVAVHAAALRALGAHEGAALPVTVKLLVEGEEECTTEHLPELVRGHADLLRADIAVIADGGNVPHRHPHGRHERAGRHRLHDHRERDADRPAQRVLRGSGPRRDHRALPDHRLPARRRGRRHDRRAPLLRVGGQRRERGRPAQGCGPVRRGPTHGDRTPRGPPPVEARRRRARLRRTSRGRVLQPDRAPGAGARLAPPGARRRSGGGA